MVYLCKYSYIILTQCLLYRALLKRKIFQRQITKQGLNTVLDFDCGNTANNSCLNSSGKSGGGGGGRWAAKFSREELRDLFSLREDTLCDTHDLVQSWKWPERERKE